VWLRNSPPLMEHKDSILCLQKWPLIPHLSQNNPVHTHPTYFSTIHSNTILPSTPMSYKWSLPFRFPDQNICIPHLPVCYLPSQSHSPWFECTNIWWSIQLMKLMKLLITQSSPAFHHFLPLRSKYSPQHPPLKSPSI
jgi:hypothetical protein